MSDRSFFLIVIIVIGLVYASCSGPVEVGDLTPESSVYYTSGENNKDVIVVTLGYEVEIKYYCSFTYDLKAKINGKRVQDGDYLMISNDGMSEISSKDATDMLINNGEVSVVTVNESNIIFSRNINGAIYSIKVMPEGHGYIDYCYFSFFKQTGETIEEISCKSYYLNDIKIYDLPFPEISINNSQQSSQ